MVAVVVDLLIRYFTEWPFVIVHLVLGTIVVRTLSAAWGINDRVMGQRLSKLSGKGHHVLTPADVRGSLRDLIESACRVPARIGNLFLLSGVLGTMWALFRVAHQLRLDGGTLGRAQVLEAFPAAFGAFAVTIVAVSLGGAALLATTATLRRLEKIATGAQLEYQSRVGGQAAVIGDPVRAAVVSGLEEALQGISSQLLEAVSGTQAMLNGVEEAVGNAFAPLDKLADLGDVLERLAASVEGVQAFATNQDELVEAVKALHESTTGLQAAANELPSIVTEQGNATIQDLKGFQKQAEEAFNGINEVIGNISVQVGTIPKRVDAVLNKSLEAYRLGASEAFRMNVEHVGQIGAEARRQLPELTEVMSELTVAADQSIGEVSSKAEERINVLSQTTEAGLASVGDSAQRAGIALEGVTGDIRRLTPRMTDLATATSVLGEAVKEQAEAVEVASRSKPSAWKGALLVAAVVAFVLAGFLTAWWTPSGIQEAPAPTVHVLSPPEGMLPATDTGLAGSHAADPPGD